MAGMTADAPHAPVLLTMEEVARRLQVSRSSLYAQVRRGRLRIVKIGHLTRIRPAEVERYVLEHEVEGLT